jgi:hypothetical protein
VADAPSPRSDGLAEPGSARELLPLLYEELELQPDRLSLERALALSIQALASFEAKDEAAGQALMERASQCFANSPGADHWVTARMQGTYGQALLEAGRLAEAVPVLGAAEEILERQLGESDPGAAGSGSCSPGVRGARQAASETGNERPGTGPLVRGIFADSGGRPPRFSEKSRRRPRRPPSPPLRSGPIRGA